MRLKQIFTSIGDIAKSRKVGTCAPVSRNDCVLAIAESGDVAGKASDPPQLVVSIIPAYSRRYEDGPIIVFDCRHSISRT